MSDLLLWFQICHSHKPIMMLVEFTTEMVLKWVFGIKQPFIPKSLGINS